jgi:hypothetical protein
MIHTRTIPLIYVLHPSNAMTENMSLDIIKVSTSKTIRGPLNGNSDI